MSKRIGFFSFYEGSWYHEYYRTSRGYYMHAQGILGCYMGLPSRCSRKEYYLSLSRVKTDKVDKVDYVSEVALLDNGDITSSNE